MKKELAYKFAHLQGLTTLENVVVVESTEVIDVDNSQLKKVLDEIFSIDPVSGLPRGDIQYFLSKDGNPEVKAWLETNLLQPRRSVSSNPDGVTDDMIAEFAPKSGESRSDYAARLVSLRDEAIKNAEEIKKRLSNEEK